VSADEEVVPQADDYNPKTDKGPVRPEDLIDLSAAQGSATEESEDEAVGTEGEGAEGLDHSSLERGGDS
jgi:hypothetical protein